MKQIEIYKDSVRNVTFRVGDIVHWFKYSSDMIIIDGGYGLLVSINQEVFADCLENVLCSILVDDGSLQTFSPNDLDQEDRWSEDECSNPEKW
tara:strand:- start:24 stop:302 length:279 start_codon:yes stop_codon:yes gene_type:complete